MEKLEDLVKDEKIDIGQEQSFEQNLILVTNELESQGTCFDKFTDKA